MSNDPNKQFLSEFMALNEPSTSPSSLIVKITSAVNTAIDTGESSNKIEGLLWRTWNAIIATASATPPEEQEKLAGLMKALRQQPVLKNKEGQDVKIWDQKVWPDLPVFGAAAREAFNAGEIYRTGRYINL